MKQRPSVFDDRPAQRLKLREQEQQLIEVIRENAADDGFRLLLERQSDVWEVMLKVPIKGRKKHGTVRGIGSALQ
jgi:hypothetical protein